MKTYLKILAFAKPLSTFTVPYFIFTFLSVIFSLVNISLLIPLLDTIIGELDPEKMARYASLPELTISASYLIDIFYFYFYSIILNNGKLSALQFVCSVVVISVFFTSLFAYLGVRVFERFRARTIKNIRAKLYHHLSGLPLGYYKTHKKSDVMSRVVTDAYEVESSIADSMKSLLKDPFTLLAYLSALFLISFKLTIFTMLVIPVSGVGIAYVVRKLRQDAVDSQDSISRLLGIIDETIDGLKMIKAFNALDYMRAKFDHENERYARKTRALAYKRELGSPVSEFMGIGVVAGIMYYGGALVIQDQSSLTPSEFLTYIAIFTQVLRPAKNLTSVFTKVQRGLVASERILQLLATRNDLVEKENPVVVEAFNHQIEFKSVTFAYEKDPVLHRIDLTIGKGQTVALVGPSGGGKSTLADLIPRFYDVQQGQILFDGHDLRDCSLDSLHQMMGIVSQEPILFYDTVFNNIAFGKPGARMEEVVHAAKVANAHDFIMMLEKGYDTVIGERGMKLSGGQRQRLSIARAVFKNPPILILDEATSALDTESERLVQDALEKLMQNRTSLVIAHRLSTIQHADQIVVVEKGRIVEQGTHAELLAKANGTYKRLHVLQVS
jgi:subfamily B ATP-binding cassette protein MsbA